MENKKHEQASEGPAETEAYLSAAEFAKLVGVNYMTIRDRLAKGELPGAHQVKAGQTRLCWQIPARLVATFEKKRPGRKKPAPVVVFEGDSLTIADECDMCGEALVGDLVACEACGELVCEDCAEDHCEPPVEVRLWEA